MPRIVFLLAVAVGMGTLTQVAHAQYPPPIGSVTLTSSEIQAPVNSSITLTCQIRNAAGAAMAGVTATIMIEAEPGADASIGSNKIINRTTNAQGAVTVSLMTGSTPGLVVVGCQSGPIASRVVVQVLGVTATPPPPARADAIIPPTTGDAGLAAR
jgi:hypothetical protein